MARRDDYDLPRHSYRCSCCGGTVSEFYARKQYEEGNLTEGSMCKDCLRDTDLPRWIEDGIEKIADALSDENERKFRQLPQSKQIAFLKDQIERGNIRFSRVMG